jgi:phosphoserine phosphatase
MSTLILQGPGLDRTVIDDLADNLGGEAMLRTRHARITLDRPLGDERLLALRARLPFDINPIPERFDPSGVRLLISDMDSTLITIECVDEIADFIGIKPEVAKITDAAMRGEIDFETSLRRRIALLQGLDARILERVYEERLDLNEGAADLIAGVHARGIKVALVSGGFTFFTERLRQRLSLDYTLANELEIEDGRLTGHVRGSIIGAAAKAEFLATLCKDLRIHPHQVIAVGDGANDLPMLSAAGLSVGFRAKPAVQARVKVVLNHSGLDGILAFLEN